MLTIITILYNSHRVLTSCLGPLIDSNACLEVIIDNASTDGSAEELQRRFPNTTVEALKPVKRWKYRAQAEGAKAFLQGEPALLPNGVPQKHPKPDNKELHEPL